MAAKHDLAIPGTRRGPPRDLPEFLDERSFRLLLFGGKGGVGKTTCASAAALWLARRDPQRRILLTSTDPAHSVLDSFAGLQPPANLRVIEIDAPACLEDFKTKHHSKLREIASRGTFLDEQDINRFLDLSLPGLDELMAFLEISAWVESGAYDCVIADTAPSGHTLRLLQMPVLIRQWLTALDGLLAKHRYMRRVFSRSHAPDELDVFLQEMAGSVSRMEELLQDSARCRFIPVLLAESLSIRETTAMMRELARLKMPVGDLLVNRLYCRNRCPSCEEAWNVQIRELGAIFANPKLRRYRVFGIPLYAAEVRGEEALASFWDGTSQMRGPPLAAPSVSVPCGFPLPDARPAAPPNAGLVLFGGKGGVGKTTLACATAVWLAQQPGAQRILLFSSDPAHSLSDCLGVTVGPQPVGICPGLSAMEIDVQAELQSLKRRYTTGLEQFFTTLSGNFDLTFDREAMENLMDLAPPGLDEIMALSRVMDLVARRCYDVFVLDSASTGHLIRLLELPVLLEGWIKAFFELLLKYQHVFRLAEFSSQLVEMSKNLKRLRKLLGDPANACLYTVSIATEMALEETRDLAAACARAGIHVPAMFLNLMTPAGDCPLCTAIHHREELIRGKFHETFPKQQHYLVYRNGEMRGVSRLVELGRCMFGIGRRSSVSYAS